MQNYWLLKNKLKIIEQILSNSKSYIGASLKIDDNLLQIILITGDGIETIYWELEKIDSLIEQLEEWLSLNFVY